jgi:hypothetical protein
MSDLFSCCLVFSQDRLSLVARIHPSRLANLDFNLVMEIEAACELLVHVLTAPFFRKMTKSAY